MITLWKADPLTGELLRYAEPFHSMRGLLGSAESIDAIIDREIEKFAPDRSSFRANVTAQEGVVTVAVGLRVVDKDGKGNWTVMVGADRKKDGALAGKFELIREF